MPPAKPIRTTVAVNGGEEVDVTSLLANSGVRVFLDRIVRLEGERQALAAQIKEVLTEAKEAGLHAGALRKLVKREMEDADQRDKRENEEDALEMMLGALGAFRDTPLGESAVERAGR